MAKSKTVKSKTLTKKAATLQGPDSSLAEVKVKLSKALGTNDENLQCYLINQVVLTFSGFATSDGIDKDKIGDYLGNAMAILNGIHPQDEIEGMLAVQMIGVHNMAMETMKRAMLGGQTFEGKKSNVNYATKMLRTFVAQLEVLSELRQDERTKDIIVFMLTAKNMMDDVSTALASGAHDYIIKPFDGVELGKRIMSMLRAVKKLKGNSVCESEGVVSISHKAVDTLHLN